MAGILNAFSKLIVGQVLSIDKCHHITPFRTYPSSDCSILVIEVDAQRRIGRSKLGFLDHDKINGVPNDDLPLILAITIVDPDLAGFLVDDMSLCNILYLDTTDLIGIQLTYMNPYGGRDLLAFNYSITRPQGAVDLAVTVEEGDIMRKMILNFVIVSCRSTLQVILGRSFIARLDAVASPIHFKVKYHNVEGRPIMNLETIKPGGDFH